MNSEDFSNSLDLRRAIESLRNGVPSSAAVKQMGCSQPRIEREFKQMLSEASTPSSADSNTHGFLISGDFGAGKSHLLAHLEQIAFSNNFACSKVAISKETPLNNLGKVFISAMENGRLPDKRGRFIEELSDGLVKSGQDSQEYKDLLNWAKESAANNQLNMIFAASLYLRTNYHLEPKLLADIDAFWEGDKINVSAVKKPLRAMDKLKEFQFTAPKVVELPSQRLRFTLELIKSVGYNGWIVMLDELELIGSYTVLNRGLSYAEIARWLGLSENRRFPGLIFVGAVTDDFALEIIDPRGRRKDHDKIPARLQNHVKHFTQVGDATKGMNALLHDCISLKEPSDDEIDSSLETLRTLYKTTYDWEPPHYKATSGLAGAQKRMRYKVRAAINEWDLRRLNPNYRPDTKIDEYKINYEEGEDTDTEPSEAVKGLRNSKFTKLWKRT